MSARERILILKLDDKQLREQIKILQGAAGTSSGGGGRTGAPKGMMGLVKLLSDNVGLIKVVAKLTLIFAVLTLIVKLITKITDRIVDSSPILQTMLKLMQTGITFILRPIGDFIAFFLRPFLIYFLRSIALPLYRLLDAPMRALGTFLGKNLFSNFTLQYDPEIDPFFGPSGIFSDIGKVFTEWQQQITSLRLPTFNDVVAHFKAFARKLINFTRVILEKIRPFIPSMRQIWEKIGEFAERLSPLVSLVIPLVPVALSGLKKIFNIIIDFIPTVTPILNSIAPKIIEFAKLVVGLIDQLGIPIIDAIISIGVFFKNVFELFDRLVSSIDSLLFGIPSALGLTGGGSTGSTTVTNNFFEGAFASSQESINDMFTFEGIVSRSTNSGLSGRR